MNKTTYEAKGEVLGHLWDGSIGGYPTVVVKGDTLDEVQAKAAELLDTGGLDSGMGFESLVGAFMDVKVVESRTIADKLFQHTEYLDFYIGDEKYADEVREMYFNRL